MLRSIVIVAAAIALAIIMVNVFFQVVGALFELALVLLLGVLGYWLYLRLRSSR